jgi:hypothetical protein
MAEPPLTPRQATAGGIPRGVSIGESWPAMVMELRGDKASGRRDSPGRRLVESLISPASFTEVGRLIGVTGRGADGGPGPAEPSRIPGEVVAGWGFTAWDENDHIVFAVADEVLEPTPRNPAGAAIARNVAGEALRCGAPLVSFPAATRMREDLRPAAAFMRAGVQLDLDQEQAAANTIPKIVALTGQADLPVALEMSLAHYVIAGVGSQILMPDGTAVGSRQLGMLGWADAICETEEDILATIRSVLALAPGADGQIAGATPRAGDLAADSLESLLMDHSSAIGLSRHAGGSLTAAIGRIDGLPALAASGTVSDCADAMRLAKVRRLSATFGFPVIIVTPAWDLRFAVPASDPGGVNVLVLTGPEAVADAAAEGYDVVLAWHDMPGSVPDAVINPANTRHVIADVLSSLTAGCRTPRAYMPSAAALGGWVSDTH